MTAAQDREKLREAVARAICCSVCACPSDCTAMTETSLENADAALAAIPAALGLDREGLRDAAAALDMAEPDTEKQALQDQSTARLLRALAEGAS